MAKLCAISWVLITLAGVCTIFENTAKFMAFRYEEAAKLQKLAFLPNVWNFFIDLLVMQAKFGVLQVTGFISLFIFYTYELLSFYFCQPEVKKTEDEFTRADEEVNDLDKTTHDE